MSFKDIKTFFVEEWKIIRFKAGIFYLLTGIVLIILFLLFKKPVVLPKHWIEILWCLGWAGFGVGSGLINSRYDDKIKLEKDKQKTSGWHYLLYFIFVEFIAALAAFVILENSNAKYYATAALVAIVIGFTGDKLAGMLFELKGRINN